MTQNNPFINAMFMNYEYDCNGKVKKLTDQETEHVHGMLFCVKCECHNEPVLHLLRRTNNS